MGLIRSARSGRPARINGGAGCGFADVAWRRPTYDAFLDERSGHGRGLGGAAGRARFVLGTAMVRLVVACELGVEATRFASTDAARGAVRITARHASRVVVLRVRVPLGARAVVAVMPAGPGGADVEERNSPGRDAAGARRARADRTVACDPAPHIVVSQGVGDGSDGGRPQGAARGGGEPAHTPARLVSYEGAALADARGRSRRGKARGQP